jgi:hypothetical protein
VTAGRALRRLFGGSGVQRQSAGSEHDRFAPFRSLDGPVLAGGPTVRHDPDLDARPSLVVLLPHLTLARMSGGPNTIFQVTARLAREGVPLRYVAAFGALAPSIEAIREHVTTLTGVDVHGANVEWVDASAAGASIAVGRGDVFLATWWRSAHVARSGLDHVRAGEFLYLVQDFEPGFYPWSTKYALAAATYAMPARAIINTPLLRKHLVDSGFGRFSDPRQAVDFLPSVDRAVFQARKRNRTGPRRLAFYARPRNARNLFELGLRALRVAIEEGVFAGGAWQFAAIGQELPELSLSATQLLRPEPWLPYEAYGRYLADSDVLLSLMLSPHTSYPPLEMAATGGHVVTNTFGAKTAPALAAISPRIHAAPPDVDSLVDALRSVVASVEQGDSADQEALALPATWDDALAEVTPWLVRTIGKLRAA